MVELLIQSLLITALFNLFTFQVSKRSKPNIFYLLFFGIIHAFLTFKSILGGDAASKCCLWQSLL
jgi:hypothetical protein